LKTLLHRNLGGDKAIAVALFKRRVVSGIVKEIEAEAERILEEAKRKAEEILRNAKRRAQEILEDKSYLVELMSMREKLEEEVSREARRIVEEAEKKASLLKASARGRIEEIARRIASMTAGVEV
jgi:vacuolar-type H+-ATPase subunit E/Vma4